MYYTTYASSVGGVLLGYEDVVLDDDNNPKEIHLDVDYIHVKLKATFFIFCPKIDEYLEGYVAAKRSSSVTVAVHDYFQVTCLSPKQLKNIVLQDSAQVRVTSLAYRDGRPHMFGNIEKVWAFFHFNLKMIIDNFSDSMVEGKKVK